MNFIEPPDRFKVRFQVWISNTLCLAFSFVFVWTVWSYSTATALVMPWICKYFLLNFLVMFAIKKESFNFKLKAHGSWKKRSSAFFRWMCSEGCAWAKCWHIFRIHLIVVFQGNKRTLLTFNALFDKTVRSSSSSSDSLIWIPIRKTLNGVQGIQFFYTWFEQN